MLIQRNGRAVQITNTNKDNTFCTVYYAVEKGYLTPVGRNSYSDTMERIDRYLDKGT